MKRLLTKSMARRLGCAVVMYSMLAGAVTPAHAVSGTNYVNFVSQIPGVYATPPDVNVMFTLDDSGSMAWEFIPDTSDAITAEFWSFPTSSFRLNTFKLSSSVYRYYRSSAGNPLYYNPAVRYVPWPFLGDDKKTYPNSSITAACRNADGPTLPSSLPASAVTCGSTRNVAARIVVNAPDNAAQDDETKGYWPATYFRYKGPTTGPDALLPNGSSAQTSNVIGNFEKIEIRPGNTYPRENGVAVTKAAGRTDCAGATCTYEEEIQNFANWFTYYRSRMLMAKGGVAHAFARQGTNLRVGFGTLHSGESTLNDVDGVPTRTVTRGVRKFVDDPTDTSKQYRKDFYQRLYGARNGNATPLRRAADDVGKYFQRTGAGSPWANDPTASDPKPEYSCRRSFHVLSTDGFWNTGAASTPASEDNDNFSGKTPPKPDGTRYDYSDSIATSLDDDLLGRFTISPFKDNTGTSGTLADVAAYYWKTDLRTDMDNKVIPSRRDPAFWQHLTTFTIGLGITGTGGVKKSDGTVADLTTQASRDDLVSKKTPLTWTIPTSDAPETGDDLIHAALNGRGQYFSATNPTDLANGLTNALSEVVDQPLDQASVAADAPQLTAGGKVYQATFSPARWYGRLYAFEQEATTGKVNNRPTDGSYTNPTQKWEASNKMPAPDKRSIFTSSGTAGSAVTFEWTNLTTAQQGFLNNDPTLLSYLRGDPSREVANNGPFRDRSRYTVAGVTGGVLGDIVNGSPVKGPDAGGDYQQLKDAAAAAAYTSFRSANALQNMRNTIFFSANDGMLHAVDTGTGVERFAYVPNAVYNVPRSTPGEVAEQKLKMLADPAYPHRFTADGPPNVSDAYLDGAWRTVLTASNGAGARGIFAMDVTDTDVASAGFGAGKIMWEFTEANNADVGFIPSYPHVARMRDGSWAVIFGNGLDSVNGQAKLFIVDLKTGTLLKEFAVGTAGNNGLSQPNFVLTDRVVTDIYAGDLKGNLWKFDVSDSNPANWKVAFGGTPLFKTPVVGGVAQPITVMPEIEANPDSLGGVVISFGTGKLVEASDTAPDGSTPPNVNLKTQTIYGIWDKPGETTGIVGARETVLKAQTANPVASGIFGTTSANSPDWAVHRGWYLDLAAGPSGERVTLSPQIVRSTLFVVANTPKNVPCENGGTSRVFALDPVTGAAPKFAVFQTGNVLINNNGVMTQPMFQFTGQTYDTSKARTGAPYSRGDVSAARRGGYEPTFKEPAPCEALMTAAMADTSLSQNLVKLCQKRRISWRQLQ